MPRKNLAAAAVALVAVVTCALAWQAGWIPRPAWHRAAPNLLLVSIDTLRADRLGSYGYAAAQTPVLDALAARGAPLRAGDDRRAAHAAGAHARCSPGTFPALHGVRDNGGFYVGDEQHDAGRGAAGARLPHRRVRRRVRARSALGHRAGVRHATSTTSTCRRYEMTARSRRGPAARAARSWTTRSRGSETDRDRAVLRVGASLRSAQPLRAARAVPLALSRRRCRERTTARSRRPTRRSAGCWRTSRSADASTSTVVVVVGDHGESLGEHGEQQHGFFVYDAATHIPLIVAGPGVPVTRRARPGAHRRRDADDARLARVPKPCRGAGREPRAACPRRAAGPARRSVETWYPRYHYGWSELTAVQRRPLQVHRGATPRALRHRGRSRRDAGPLGAEPAAWPTRSNGRCGTCSRRRRAARPRRRRRARGRRRSRSGCARSATSAASVSRTALDDRPRGDPKDKIGLYNLLKLAGQDSVGGPARRRASRRCRRCSPPIPR